MPGFHHSVPVLLFRRSIVPLPFFRSVAAIAIARENGIAGNVFPLTVFEVTRTLIGCPPMAERQKIGFDPICYGTAVTAQRQVGTATAQENFLRRQPNSYRILTEFL